MPRKFANRRLKVTQGGLEKLIAFEGKRVPLWRALRERGKRAKTPEEYWANDAFLDEQWEDLSLPRFLAMWGDLALGAYGIGCPALSNTPHRKRPLARDPKIRTWTISMLEQLAAGGPDVDLATSDVWKVVARAALANRVPWPPNLYKRLPLDEITNKEGLALVALIPIERRTEALIATIDRMARDTAHALAPVLLARWPSRELAQWVIDHSEEQDESQRMILGRLKKLAKQRPAIAAALARS